MVSEACHKCSRYEAEYEAPGSWCRFCWVEWWFEEDPDAPIRMDEYLKHIEEEDGPAVEVVND